MAELLKQKKGVTYPMMLWILKIGLVSALFVFIIIIAGYFNATSVNSAEGRTVIFINRLMYSPTSLAYVDSTTQRVYPGMIDMEKFDAKKLEKSIYFEEQSLIAANLTLEILQENNPSIDKSVTYNGKDFKMWWPLRGFNEYLSFTKPYYVLVYDKGKISTGTLTIELVTRNI
ncbi:hypothetical protein KY339_00720 [Candidatus Woesearchaeota archaeon]|nr:hypothetical protein [Candidatus Woesearchaeota archaeon]